MIIIWVPAPTRTLSLSSGEPERKSNCLFSCISCSNQYFWVLLLEHFLGWNAGSHDKVIMTYYNLTEFKLEISKWWNNSSSWRKSKSWFMILKTESKFMPYLQFVKWSVAIRDKFLKICLFFQSILWIAIKVIRFFLCHTKYQGYKAQE